MKPLIVKYAGCFQFLFLVSMPGLLYAGDHASRGIDFKAQGNSPDWHLEIVEKDNKISFTTETGEYVYKYPAGGPMLYPDRNATVYRVPNNEHTMTVTVKGIACQDNKTGKSYETTVIVTFDSKGYAGCGDVLNR
jgi:uncharacterized membrane protein